MFCVFCFKEYRLIFSSHIYLQFYLFLHPFPLVFHYVTHYEYYDLVCFDKNNNRFNIIKTENNIKKAELLNSIRDKEILIGVMEDAARDMRFERSDSIASYCENIRIDELKELKKLKLKLEEEEKEKREDLTPVAKKELSKEDIVKILNGLRIVAKYKNTDDVQKRIRDYELMLKYKK